MRHAGVILFEVDMHLGVGGRQEGVAGERLAVGPQIGAQRHYRPPHKAWFIHKYQRIAISQRCHHFTVDSTTPPTHLRYPHLLFTRQSNMINPIPSYLSLSCWPSIWLYIQYATEATEHDCVDFNQQQPDKQRKRDPLFLLLSVNDRNRVRSAVTRTAVTPINTNIQAPCRDVGADTPDREVWLRFRLVLDSHGWKRNAERVLKHFTRFM